MLVEHGVPYGEFHAQLTYFGLLSVGLITSHESISVVCFTGDGYHEIPLQCGREWIIALRLTQDLATHLCMYCTEQLGVTRNQGHSNVSMIQLVKCHSHTKQLIREI